MIVYFQLLAHPISYPYPLESKFLLNGITKETTLSDHLSIFLYQELNTST